MRKIKVLALLLALCLMVGVTGCGSKEDSALGASDVSAPEEQPVETNAQDTTAALTAGEDTISAGV